MSPVEPAGRPSAERRRLQLARSAWFSMASLYLLFVIAATVVIHRTGIHPVTSGLVNTHAAHVAEMTFESLYSLMLAGAGREQLQQAALRLEHTGPGLTIGFARGPRLVEEFGELRDSRMLKETIPDVRNALRTGRPQSTGNDSELRVAYPATFRQQCLECHARGTPDEVAAVIVVTYPTGDVAAPENRALLTLVLYFALGWPVVMLATWAITRRAR